MKDANRDLLVLSKKLANNAAALEHEIECLNKILFVVENMYQFSIANEVIDINRFKIITLPNLVQQAIRQRSHKPFVFINCKN
jgi:hypothetical protein